MAGAILEVVDGNAAGSRIAVDAELLIGRGAAGQGRLGGDDELSRRHARLVDGSDGVLWLQDLGSTNGTYLNGARLTGRAALQAGDHVRVGRTTMRVILDAAPGLNVEQDPTRVLGGPASSARRDQPARGAGAAAQAPHPGPPIEQAGSPSSVQNRPPKLPAIPPPADVLHAGRRVQVPPAGLAIGRSRASDLVLSTPEASRSHARVEPRDGRYYLADLATVNGTSLNGELLRGASRWLNTGDTITIGGESLRFLIGQATQFGGTQLPSIDAQTIRFEGDRLTIGRDPTNDVALEDPNVTRFHAEVRAGSNGVELRDLGSRNGTRVDGLLIDRATLKSGSEVGVGPFRLVFDGSAFVRRDDRGALRVYGRDVTVSVDGKVILSRASLGIEPGEFVVIIGESGSGKTTLIKALAGVSRPSKGAVSVNGEPVLSRLTDIGYVPQDEIVHGELTVLEALQYAARLRLPTDATREDIDSAIRRVLDELSLVEHAKTRIASLSGGQRKRAGMAAELLNRPSLLFLDEPTTGLDPGLETRMMELFESLSSEGTRAVAVVTHATKNLDRADKVCVMARGGEIAFFGPPDEAKSFFGVETYDGIYSALEDGAPSGWRRQVAAQRELEAPTVSSDPAEATVSSASAAAPTRRRRTGRQVGVLTARYLKLIARDRRNLLILLGQVPVIALGVGLLFRSGVLDPPGQGKPSDAAQLLFLLVTTAIWLGAIDGSREIIKERALALREAAVGVRHAGYLLSKALVLFGLVAIQITLLAGVVFALRPLSEPLATYAAVLSVLMLTGFVAVGMGLVVSASVASEDQATSFIPLILIPQLLFAGALVPVESMGSAIAALSNVIFARWSFATLGTSIGMNERFGADPRTDGATEFGPTFFELPLPTGAALLLLFLLGFFATALFLLHRRRA